MSTCRILLYGVELTAEYDSAGKWHDATRTDPAEGPAITITALLTKNGDDIWPILSDTPAGEQVLEKVEYEDYVR